MVMSIQQITPNQAKEILDQDPEAVYLDVRSIPEFIEGHAQGAINIPLLHFDEGEQMLPNPDFSKVSSVVLPKDKKLLVGCKAGGRSQRACEILSGLGYHNLHNIMGGFGGGINTVTGGYQKGWKDSGLPVTRDNNEGASYESLVARAKK